MTLAIGMSALVFGAANEAYNNTPMPASQPNGPAGGFSPAGSAADDIEVSDCRVTPGKFTRATVTVTNSTD